jgi:hypothetical protein
VVGVFGVPVVVAVAVVTSFNLHEAFSTEPVKTSTSAIMSTSALKSKPASNVYHLVFDSYSSLLFPQALRQMHLEHEFMGFTFFSNNLSNYDVTDASVPSFMTGELFKGGSLKEFQLKAKNDGLRRELQKIGYSVSIYSPDQAGVWMYVGASLVRTSQDIAKVYFSHNNVFWLAQISLVRITPNPLRQTILQATDNLFARIMELRGNSVPDLSLRSHGYSYYKRLTIPLIDKFLEDEQKRLDRGNYVYLHVMLPHQPFVRDKNCDGVAEGTVDFSSQTLCATKMIVEIIRELKRLNHFENSLIIIQSDHGFHNMIVGDPHFDPIATEEVRDKIRATLKGVLSVDGYLRRARALLLIKPPLAKLNDLSTSLAPTQLVDIPATIYDLLRIEAPSTDGQSVFLLNEASPRTIHLFPGVYQRDEKGNAGVLGRRLKEAMLGHLSYSEGGGWQVYPDIPATHEGWAEIR